ncbi:hypothetical protein GCM10017690_09790 [Microbacterium terregens]
MDDSVVEDTYRRKRVPRTYAALISGVVLLVCAGAVAAYLILGPWSSTLLIGSASGFQIGYVAGVTGLVAFTVFVLTVSAKRCWLVVAIPLGITATAILVLAMILLPLTETKVTPILVDGYSSGYIAVEESNGSGFVGVQDGLHVLSIHQYRADDFGTPFSNGTYRAVMRGDEIDVAYDGGRGFSLPAHSAPPCR